MQTLADFKRAMQVGSKWQTIQNGLKPERETTIRECSIRQTNSFAFATLINGELKNTWLDFPKASEISFLDCDTISINKYDYPIIYKLLK